MIPPSESIPRIPFNLLPAAERQGAWFVQNHMLSMWEHVTGFQHAVELFDHVSEQFAGAADWASMRRSEAWQKIAGDQGGLAIYHFGHAVRNIFGEQPKTGKKRKRRCALDDCGTLRSIIGAADDASFMSRCYVDFWSVRNAVAHLEENSNIAEIDHHRRDGVFVASQFTGRTYRFTVESRQPDGTKIAADCSYELSSATTICLAAVMGDVFAVIDRAGHELKSRKT